MELHLELFRVGQFYVLTLTLRKLPFPQVEFIYDIGDVSMLISRLKNLTLAAALLAGLVTEANASDNLFQQFVGNYGVSTAGWGSLSQTGTISIDVPVGSTVTGAWLYSSTFGQPSEGTPGGTLGGTVVDYNTALGANPDVTSLEAFRADVTGIVAPVVNGGLGGTYNFSITETQRSKTARPLSSSTRIRPSPLRPSAF